MRSRREFFNPTFHVKCPLGHMYSKDVNQCPICYAPKTDERVQEVQGRKNKSNFMIQNFTIKLTPVIDPREMLRRFQEGKGFTPEDSVKLSQVKARIEVVADYTDMEQVRDLLKKLSAK